MPPIMPTPKKQPLKKKEAASPSSRPRRLTVDDLARFNAEADRRLNEHIRESKAEREAADRRLNEHIRESKAERESADRRVDKVLKRMGEDHEKNEGYRRNAARALEDAFAASLPKAARESLNIKINPRDIRVRARGDGDNQSREFDFIAPNGDLVLTGEVKARLTRKDVGDFCDALREDFRESFPEYAAFPVYGIVAGGAIDPDAAALARKRGLYIMRMEGAALHPETAKNYRPRKY